MPNLRDVVIAGVGLTRFVKYQEGKDYWDYGSEAVLNALEDAGVEFKDIQTAFCGSVYTDTGSGHHTLAEIGMSGIPIINIENACSSGSSSLRLAYQSIAAGFYDIALVVGFDVIPRSGFLPSTAWPEWQRYMGFNVQPAGYALRIVRYMEETGVSVEDFARISVKNRKNGALNPNAIFQKPVTMEEVMNSRVIAEPLRLLHCCPLAQGAAAAVLCSRDKLRTTKKPVQVAATILVSGLYGNDEHNGPSVKVKAMSRIELAAKQAFEASGYGPGDMDVVQVYDTMAPGEFWGLEGIGFCQKGETARLLKEGTFDINGRLPVNTDGGLLSRGHPMGATALAQIIEIVKQLRGEAGPRQVRKARIGLAHAMGAGPNASITILKV